MRGDSAYGGGRSGARHTLATGSHHQPLSQASGVVEIGARHVLATGSHQPFSQFGTRGAAALTAGLASVVNASETNAATATRAARWIDFRTV